MKRKARWAYGAKTNLALSATGQGFSLGQDVLKGQGYGKKGQGGKGSKALQAVSFKPPYSCSPRLVSVTDVGPGMTRRRL